MTDSLPDDLGVTLTVDFAVGALVLSAAMVIAITFIVFWIMRKAGFKYWDIIREKDFHPSLSRFQFLLWTWIVSFVFASVVFIRGFAGVLPIPLEIPSNLLILIGVSAAPAAISSGVNQVRYSAAIERAKKDLIRFRNMAGIREVLRTRGIALQQNANAAQAQAIRSAAQAAQDKSNAEFAVASAQASMQAAQLASQAALFGDPNAPNIAKQASVAAVTTAATAAEAQTVAQASKAQALRHQAAAQAAADDVPLNPDIPLEDIFNEDGKPAMTRFQMFVWTFIAIIVYFILFGMTLYSMLSGSLLSHVEALTIPDVDTTMVTLMSLSQGAYVAGKMSKST